MERPEKSQLHTISDSFRRQTKTFGHTIVEHNNLYDTLNNHKRIQSGAEITDVMKKYIYFEISSKLDTHNTNNAYLR